jgi:hypothetical protein
MKIKLKESQIATLEVYVLDKIDSYKMRTVKGKFLNPDKNGFIHLSNSEYLFTLTCIENNICDPIMDIYELLVKQDTKDLIKPMEIQYSII